MKIVFEFHLETEEGPGLLPFFRKALFSFVPEKGTELLLKVSESVFDLRGEVKKLTYVEGIDTWVVLVKAGDDDLPTKDEFLSSPEWSQVDDVWGFDQMIKG